MKTFKQYLNEAYNQRIDIPYDGKTNAPTRFNNPGGAYPRKDLEPYGLEGYGVIGGGHKIGKYPSVAHGVAANIAHLRKLPVVGGTVANARHYWVNGRPGSMDLPGMDNSQIITQELLQDPNWLAQWMVATARAEGFQGRLDQQTFNDAFRILNEAPPTRTPDYDGSNVEASDTQNMPPEEAEAEPEEYGTIGGALLGLLGGLRDLGSYGAGD